MKKKNGFLALTPLLLFLCLYLVTSIVLHDFDKMPLTLAFLFSSVYAVALSSGSLEERIKTFSTGAGNPSMMLVIWIFILAGAFAAAAKSMGAVDAAVGFTLRYLPPALILPGLFLASCFISLSIGTSVGTIVALTPIAVSIASVADISLPMMTGLVVGGAFFGDNLSFISDTTIVATQTQGCKMCDKFKANIRIVLPVAVIILIIYTVLGIGLQIPADAKETSFVKIIPYLAVIVTAVLGWNVLLVLMVGIFLTGLIGIADGSYGFFDWLNSMAQGIIGMGELIIITMMAGGLLAIVRANGGIEYLITTLSSKVQSKKGGEACIAGLVCLVDICTANNTVALITTGPIAHEIAQRFDIDPRRSSSLLDTASCFMQGVLPYGAQLLIASQLVCEVTKGQFNSFLVIPYLFYPFALAVAVILSVISGYPKMKRK